MIDEVESSDYTAALADAGIEELKVNQILPSLSVTPQELQTDSENAGDLNEFMARMLAAKRESQPA
jgi:hypothetical protein